MEDEFENRLDNKKNRDRDLRDSDPLAFVRLMVQRQAKELAQELGAIEDRITVVGKELDMLHKARETLFNTLRGTEKVRVEINEALGEFGDGEPVGELYDHRTVPEGHDLRSERP